MSSSTSVLHELITVCFFFSHLFTFSKLPHVIVEQHVLVRTMVNICKFTSVRVCVCVCVCMYISIYIYTYVYILGDINTYMLP
jgi:hypothetical protein